MYQIKDLVEQHILESEARLRHIDEQISQMNEIHAKHPKGSAAESQFTSLKWRRDNASEELSAVRRTPAQSNENAMERGVHLKESLQRIGQDLEGIFAELFK